jgi:arylsulfatase
MVLLGAAGVGGASLLVLHLRPLPPDRIRNRGSRLVSLAAWLAVAALAVIAAKTVSFGGAEARLSEVSAGKPNILLISIDALRADAVGCLSETAPPTPEMDKLAGRGVAFSAAFAQSPWTFPSFASLMTSTFPSEAGINLFGEGEIDFPGMNLSLGGSSVPMLAELLKKGGYQTSAQVTNPVLFPARHCGWDRGFDSYRHCDEPIRMLPFHALVTHLVPRLRPRYRSDDAEAVTRGAVAWLRKNARQPFFLWVHYLDPHHPYCPPGCAAASDPDWAIAWRASADSIRLGMQCKSLAAREKLRILYDAEVTYVDHWVGELLAAVDDLGCKERTLVVLTADHGEEFWEHGGWEHGHCLHDEVIRVPLLVAFPDGRHAGETVGRPVALLDVMPTVLEVAGLDLPRHIRGLSLLGLLDGRSGAVAADRAMFAEGLAFGPELKGIRAGEWLVTFRPEDGSFEEFREGAITSGSPGKSSARVDPGALRERLKSWAAEMRRAAPPEGGAGSAWLPVRAGSSHKEETVSRIQGR